TGFGDGTGGGSRGAGSLGKDTDVRSRLGPSTCAWFRFWLSAAISAIRSTAPARTLGAKLDRVVTPEVALADGAGLGAGVSTGSGTRGGSGTGPSPRASSRSSRWGVGSTGRSRSSG